MASAAAQRPAALPAVDRIRPCTISGRAIRLCIAPSAERMANSRPRAANLVTNRPTRLMPAITTTSAAAARPGVKAVVDTNVAAYLVLGTEEFAEEARNFMDSVDEAWAPALWEASRPGPLAVGVHEQIFPIAEGLGISRRFVRRFLGRWTSSSEYLCALTRAGAERVNLDGSPAGEIDDQHRSRAERRLSRPSKTG